MSDTGVVAHPLPTQDQQQRNLVSGRPTLWPWVRRNSLGVGIGIVSMVATMLFLFFYPTIVDGHHAWLLSGNSDIWAQWRAAGLLPNPGGYTQIFHYDSLLKTPPGWELLISPIAHRFLSWPFPYVAQGYAIAHPKALWVAGPTELLAVPFCLCAIDVWLRRLGVSIWRRVGTLFLLALVLPPVSVWGHPEDLMALACGLLAIRALRDDRWSAGWWMGAAFAFQVEVILLFPLCVVLVSRRRRVPFVLESLAVPLAVLAVPLIGAFHTTVHALAHQSIFPGSIRFTPTRRLFPYSATAIDLVTLALAVGVAAAVWRRRDRISDASVFWLIGALYALRLLYPSMFPYYLVPAMAVFCAASARTRPYRFAGTLLIGGVMTWWLEYVPVNGSWLNWAAVGFPLAVMALASFPPREARLLSPPATATAEPVPEAVPASSVTVPNLIA